MLVIHYLCSQTPLEINSNEAQRFIWMVAEMTFDSLGMCCRCLDKSDGMLL